jgi:hypothetical protein
MFRTFTLSSIILLTSCGMEPATFIVGSSSVLPWPRGVIPYEITPGFTSTKERLILEGMRDWEEVTDIKFVPRTTEFNYVVITPGENCLSFVGFMGIGPQILELASGCWRSEILHELGHTIGLIHEHQRFDRDKYVEINWSNIDLETRGNFIRISRLEAQVRTEYDPFSIMHYDSYTFSKTFAVPVITLKNSENLYIPYNKGVITESDAQKVKDLYGF